MMHPITYKGLFQSAEKHTQFRSYEIGASRNGTKVPFLTCKTAFWTHKPRLFMNLLQFKL